MAKVNLLSDFDVEAIAVVTKGANRKRWFMRKSGEEPPLEDLVEAPGRRSVIAKSDWSRVYCVVAEPGWHEDPGQLSSDRTPDEWASEEEILKAQASFVRNGGKINKLHSEIAPYGLAVENAIALADFTVSAPDGTEHTIRKGSWYIAIEPTEEGREEIEAGTFTGISLEGSANRTLVDKGEPTTTASVDDLREAAAEVLERIEKAETFSKPGTADVTPADRKKIKPLARHYLSKPHPFTACKRDQIKHGLTPDHANRRCAVLLDTFDPKRKRHSTRKSSGGGSTIPGMSAKLGTWIAKKLGASDEELAELTAEEREEIEKGATFGERMAADQLSEQLPKGMDLLRHVIFRAVHDPDVEDPMKVIRTSMDEFCDWAEGLLASPEKVQKQRELVADEVSVRDDGSLGDEMDRSEIENIVSAKIEEAVPSAINKALEPLSEKLDKLGEGEGGDAGADGEKGDKGGEPGKSREDVAKSVSEIGEKLDTFIEETNTAVSKIASDLDTLAEGDSEQNGGENGRNGRVEKSELQELGEEIL